jgi:hypothetical protein
MADAYELAYTAEFIEDLQDLNAEAEQDPRGEAAKTLRVTVSALHDLRSGRERGTHRLGYMGTYPDLSDCETSYIGTDPNRRPEHRLVWRELPPAQPRGLPRRQVIALGPREGGEVYREAGRRLEREPGIRLENLPSSAERAVASRETLRSVRENAREQQRRAHDEDHDRVIGRGEREIND